MASRQFRRTGRALHELTSPYLHNANYHHTCRSTARTWPGSGLGPARGKRSPCRRRCSCLHGAGYRCARISLARCLCRHLRAPWRQPFADVCLAAGRLRHVGGEILAGQPALGVPVRFRQCGVAWIARYADQRGARCCLFVAIYRQASVFPLADDRSGPFRPACIFGPARPCRAVVRIALRVVAGGSLRNLAPCCSPTIQPRRPTRSRDRIAP